MLTWWCSIQIWQVSLNLEPVEQPTGQDSMLADNISANHWYIYICTCHRLCTILRFQQEVSCHIYITAFQHLSATSLDIVKETLRQFVSLLVLTKIWYYQLEGGTSLALCCHMINVNRSQFAFDFWFYTNSGCVWDIHPPHPLPYAAVISIHTASPDILLGSPHN